jgi:hypothetical protein
MNIQQKFAKTQIMTLEDIREFFVWLEETAMVSWHPDERFENYVNNETGEQSFSDEDCGQYNTLMKQSFAFFSQYGSEVIGVDIYSFAIHNSKLHQALMQLGDASGRDGEGGSDE